MKKNLIYTILASVLLTAVILISGVLVGLKLSGGSVGTVGTMAATDAAEDPVAGGSDGSIAIPGFEKMVMKSGQADQVVDFYNPEKNVCYFRISITLADGTELYRSGMIRPGQKIDKIEISRPLKAGTYEDAVLQYDCYTLEDLQSLNGSKTILDLEVKP